jgi:hypothetical protein
MNPTDLFLYFHLMKEVEPASENFFNQWTKENVQKYVSM